LKLNSGFSQVSVTRSYIVYVPKWNGGGDLINPYYAILLYATCRDDGFCSLAFLPEETIELQRDVSTSTTSRKASMPQAKNKNRLQDLQVGGGLPLARLHEADMCTGFAELNVTKESPFVRGVSNLE
jgi:hypothetical protein